MGQGIAFVYRLHERRAKARARCIASFATFMGAGSRDTDVTCNNTKTQCRQVALFVSSLLHTNEIKYVGRKTNGKLLARMRVVGMHTRKLV